MADSVNNTEAKCKNLSISYFDSLRHFPLISDRKTLIPYSFAKENRILPVEEKEEHIVVAFQNPEAYQVLQELRVFFGKEIIRVGCSKEVLEESLERCYHKNEEMSFAVSEVETKKAEEYDLLDDHSSHPTIRLVNSILLDAIQQGASDIHFEPKDEGLDIRVRIDGVLQKRILSPDIAKSQVLTRLKVMAKLDIAEKRLPQDGRVKLMLGEREIDFRVSTIPVVQGERIVLRILDKGNILLGLGKIGMPDLALQKYKKLLSCPEGIILVTGPTGSGKTTTLYSSLIELPSIELNIMTIEDPIEYKLPSIAQIGVNPKISLSFSSGLRHILRQDPDVIMVGEIRDVETAKIAIQASLTGHLVFSTLHTNDAPSAIARLCDMGIEPYLLASSIIGIVAQRLVRKICSFCKHSYEPSKEEKKKLQLTKELLYKGEGCQKCNYTGYKGRTGIYEFLPITKNIKETILYKFDSSTVREAAGKSFQSLEDHGIILAVQGITTSSEVFRVTKTAEVE